MARFGEKGISVIDRKYKPIDNGRALMFESYRVKKYMYENMRMAHTNAGTHTHANTRMCTHTHTLPYAVASLFSLPSPLRQQ